MLPGALGAVSLLTALFGFSVLPISWAGLALVLLGVGLLVADVHVQSHGALTVSGLIALGIGLATLFHNAPAPYHTSIVPLIVTFTAGIGGFWAIAISKAVAVRRVRSPSGRRRSSAWRASCATAATSSSTASSGGAVSADPLTPGERVLVDGQDGMTVTVHRV